jgi:hypothetical protein
VLVIFRTGANQRWQRETRSNKTFPGQPDISVFIPENKPESDTAFKYRVETWSVNGAIEQAKIPCTSFETRLPEEFYRVLEGNSQRNHER